MQGIDHIGIGSGFDKLYNVKTNDIRNPLDYSKLISQLILLGFSDFEIKKIIYLNFQRVLKSNIN
jgi:microsomal dipeptidase-like Zn-dependent dipeptidase